MMKLLKAEFQDTMAFFVKRLHERPHHFHGYDWFELSEEEEFVFNIDRARWPMMIEAHSAFYRFKLITNDHYSDEAIAQARSEHPEWCGECVEFSDFAAFAKELAGLSYRESQAVYWKYVFWDDRAELVSYRE